jgi:hypothetical protein
MSIKVNAKIFHVSYSAILASLGLLLNPELGIKHHNMAGQQTVGQSNEVEK